jgi:hypothetical protein
MTTSSQPTILSNKSIDDLLNNLTIDLSDTTTVTGSSSDYLYSHNSNTMSTITLSPSITSIGAVGGTYSIGSVSSVGNSINTVSIDSSSFTFHMPEEWVDSFPAWSRVEDMCKKYPGLEIALRNFQTVYQLVKDDYDNPTPKK